VNGITFLQNEDSTSEVSGALLDFEEDAIL